MNDGYWLALFIVTGIAVIIIALVPDESKKTNNKWPPEDDQ